MAKKSFYFSKNKISMVPLNQWDITALILILSFIALLGIGTKQMTIPYFVGQALPISLDPRSLPNYALRSVLRMLFALVFSLLATFIFGTWAAKSKRARRIIIPMIDVLQSVPILGFLSITVVAFINLFPGSLLGPECAAIFAIFTSQAWNMILSFYQSLRTVPNDLLEASDILRLSAWQRFWRIEVPFAMPGLLWNTMMSMSASWFFVVASEAITVSNQNISLPGIGSYIAMAIKQANIMAVVYAIIAMFVVVLLYDQFLFRPLIKWAEKFKLDSVPMEYKSSTWLTKVLQRTYALKYLGQGFAVLSDNFINFSLFKKPSAVVKNSEQNKGRNGIWDWLWNIFVFLLVLSAAILLIKFVAENIQFKEIGRVLLLGLYTALRVFAVLALSTLIWVPLGVWIGLRPNVASVAQPIIQFLAAFPAYLLFPIIAILIVKFHLNVQIWVTPLMLLGTQWYVAFNVIAGTMSIPKDLHLAIKNFGIKGWLKWRRFIIPGIFPYYITGAITAVGGAWNTSIVTEIVSWGDITLKATGLGAYITEYTTLGDYPRIALGIGVMCLYVLTINRVLWRPLYDFAERRFRLE